MNPIPLMPASDPIQLGLFLGLFKKRDNPVVRCRLFVREVMRVRSLLAFTIIWILDE